MGPAYVLMVAIQQLGMPSPWSLARAAFVVPSKYVHAPPLESLNDKPLSRTGVVDEFDPNCDCLL